MRMLIGGAGFIETRLQEILDNFKIYDKILLQDDYIDITNKNSFADKLNGMTCCILLAAENKDDVTPISKYYKTNVNGTKNVLDEMDRLGYKNLIFTSSVAVYGLNKVKPNEKYPVDPFNHYGKIKWQGTKVLKMQKADTLHSATQMIFGIVLNCKRKLISWINIICHLRILDMTL